MTNSTSYISLAMVAIFLENAVFTRALGASRILRVAHKEQNTSKFVLMLTVMMTIGSAICYPINLYIPSTGTGILRLLKPCFFTIAVGLSYIVIVWFLSRFHPKTFNKTRELLNKATFNSAVLGTIFLMTYENYTFLQCIFVGIATGIGFWVATAVISEGHNRIQMTAVPEPFMGLPAKLIYLGIISLAFYGLIGHQLAH
ncbi:MAG: hypothetical protein IJC83_03225 [Oscillospiraceae bacterium]|nr:hypothetical protein [Oscillospiraceae bacterium]